MSDPLDDLKRAFERATPEPDADRKTRNQDDAQKIFDRAQGSTDGARPTSDRPKGWAGIATGVRHMLNTLTSRPALTATTALVAVGVVALLPVLRDVPSPLGGLEQPELETRERAVADEAAADLDDAVSEADIAEEAPVEMEETIIVAPSMAEISDGTLYAPPPSPSPSVSPLAGAASEMRSAPAGKVIGGIVAPAPADAVRPEEPNTETFAKDDDNPVKVVTEEPVSTFSIDVDTASYAIVRNSLMSGILPPADAVRIEEMVNYFPYDYPAPAAGEGPFRPTVTLAETPWNPDTQLMTIGLQGEMPAVEDRPPLNLVFLIDTSGSMQDANKLPLLKQSFRLMLSELRPEDQVAIVTYAGSAGLALEATPAGERDKILASLETLEAGGSTAGQQGLLQAYSVAESMADDGEVTRVILATDGDFNVGIYEPEALKDFIADKRDSGTYLSVLGFGRGNLDDATMQALAQNGNGTAAYIDTLSEARKVLVDQLTGALFPIANDVKIQVEFNPAKVAEYRLIGYETRALRREDFNNDKVDAGEIGAGHSVTAIYEITPVGSPAVLNDPLRYGASSVAPAASDDGELAFLRMRYKAPGEDASQLIEVPITEGMGTVTPDTRFAAAIAGFGQLLKDSAYTGDWSYEYAIDLANSAIGEDPFGYRRQAVELMRLAKSLSQ
ncbi:VWA domain-containing protein [Pseudoruegeria sp. HB172150]|uniref:vWA domain-containing protein n=1 Tax=Pseudoruegeria sp. HB172150 TaxID=2721164 RepID=UPI001553BABA|nr:VWA domain-containing protein [Pseudoruegeria sp. HB172150]